MDLQDLVREIGGELQGRGAPERAQQEKAYLRSSLEHYGASVPALRAVARGITAEYPTLTHDELLALVDALWAPRAAGVSGVTLREAPRT